MTGGLLKRFNEPSILYKDTLLEKRIQKRLPPRSIDNTMSNCNVRFDKNSFDGFVMDTTQNIKIKKEIISIDQQINFPERNDWDMENHNARFGKNSFDGHVKDLTPGRKKNIERITLNRQVNLPKYNDWNTEKVPKVRRDREESKPCPYGCGQSILSHRFQYHISSCKYPTKAIMVACGFNPTHIVNNLEEHYENCLDKMKFDDSVRKIENPDVNQNSELVPVNQPVNLPECNDWDHDLVSGSVLESVKAKVERTPLLLPLIAATKTEKLNHRRKSQKKWASVISQKQSRSPPA